MSKRALIAGSQLALLVLLVSLSATAFGLPAYDRWVGELDGTEPTFISPYCNDGPANYAVLSVTASVSGDYYFQDISRGYGLDIQIDVYEDSFDPGDPTQNLVDSADDYGVTFAFTAGTTYHIVISELCDTSGNAIGTWDIGFAGPGSLGSPDFAFGFEGVFSGDEPDFVHPYCDTSTSYQVLGPWTPTASGDYVYGDISISYDVDIELAIYENAFDPDNPGTNLVAALDDRGLFQLVTGEPYYFVVSPLCGPVGETGIWDFLIAGPGTLEDWPLQEEPVAPPLAIPFLSGWVLVLLALMLVAVAATRLRLS